MNGVKGRKLLRFKTCRKNETEVDTASLEGNLAILRRFLCETIDAVERGLAALVPTPNVPGDEAVSDVVPTDEEVPSRYNTRPVRMWSIVHRLGAGVPMELLSDRVDVSVPILETHYDHRSEERKARRRLEDWRKNYPRTRQTIHSMRKSSISNRFQKSR